MLEFNKLPAKDKIYYQDDAVVIYCADCRDILPLFPDKSFDLVLTDPPYLEEFLLAYKFLNKIGVTKLKEGSFLYAYCGAQFLPQMIASLEGLTWFWLFNIKHNGGAPRMWCKSLMVTSKPVIAFTRGTPDKIRWSAVDFDSESKDKLRHKWGQSEGFPAQHVELRTIPNDLVVDPFMGSGTVPYVSKILGRKCVGIEISEKYCEIAAKRCSQSVMKLEIATTETTTGRMM